jgi:hypothetical protein
MSTLSSAYVRPAARFCTGFTGSVRARPAGVHHAQAAQTLRCREFPRLNVFVAFSWVLAFPALHKPLRVLGAPLGERGLRTHHALHRRGIGVEQQMLVAAGSRLGYDTHSHNKFDHGRFPRLSLAPIEARFVPSATKDRPEFWCGTLRIIRGWHEFSIQLAKHCPAPN